MTKTSGEEMGAAAAGGPTKDGNPAGGGVTTDKAPVAARVPYRWRGSTILTGDRVRSSDSDRPRDPVAGQRGSAFIDA